MVHPGDGPVSLNGMTAEEYLIELNKAKDQRPTGILLGKAVRDKNVSPAIYEAMCNTAKDKGFKFKNIQGNDI
jgi:hypothetical protein